MNSFVELHQCRMSSSGFYCRFAINPVRFFKIRRWKIARWDIETAKTNMSLHHGSKRSGERQPRALMSALTARLAVNLTIN